MLNICYSMFNYLNYITPPPEIEKDPTITKVQYLKPSPYAFSIYFRYGVGYILAPKFTGTIRPYSTGDRRRDVGVHTSTIPLKPNYKGIDGSYRVYYYHQKHAYCGKFYNINTNFMFNVSNTFGFPDVPINEYTDINNWSIIAAGGYYENRNRSYTVNDYMNNLHCGRPTDLMKEGYTFNGLSDDDTNNNICFVFDGTCIFQSLHFVYRDIYDCLDLSNDDFLTIYKYKP